MKEGPGTTVLPLGLIRGNAFLRAAVTGEEVGRWKSLFSQHGPLTPLIVRPANDGGYYVIAGERELEAARELNISNTEAVVVPLEGDAEAHKLSLQLLSLRNSPNHLEEALIIHEILKDKTVSQADLARLCGHSLSWVSKRLHLVQSLEPTVVDLVSRRALSPATAQEIAKLPPQKQHAFACRVVTERIPKSVVERLVSLYNAPSTSEELRQQIMASPRDSFDRLRREADVLDRGPVAEGKNKPLDKAIHLVQRLFEQITDRLLASLPVQDRLPVANQLRDLCRSFITRLDALVEPVDFPQGKCGEGTGQ
jgi:ParB/RepB/Spo0J family partition protein